MPLQATSGAASYDAFGGGAAAVPNYIEDVFSTYLYTGNGTSQTITNNIDLSTKGGLVWLKGRSLGYNNYLFDTTRGTGNSIYSNLQIAQQTSATTLTAFGLTGFSIGSESDINESATTYVSWAFREQPKFFDVVTYTGTGSNTTIAHSLGAVPGCIMVKRTDTGGSPWAVYHRSLANTQYLVLNATAAVATGATWWNSTTPTSAVFSVGTDASVNASGGTYVAYIFAHDAGGFGLTGTDNVISCGSYTTSSVGEATVELGYEPQWLLVKRSSGTGDWRLADNMRGWSLTQGNILKPNLSVAEADAWGGGLFPTATGFRDGGVIANSSTVIYIAIRRGPMKVPTSGTSVFTPVAYTGTDVGNRNLTGFGFPLDSSFIVDRDKGGFNYGSLVYDRLRGLPYLITSATDAEGTTNPDSTYGVSSLAAMDGVIFGSNSGAGGLNTSADFGGIVWGFRRAPSFFDVVCYTGTGATRALTHNLGVAPELSIIKSRSLAVENWNVWHKDLGSPSAGYYYYLALNGNNARANSNDRVSTVTSTVVNMGNNDEVNASGSTYVAYLFATCAGVSKVGSYTGTGTTKQIDCGFTGGARFVLIKRVDSTGGWYVWDSARGIVSGNDPYLLLNTTDAEVTSTDYIDTYSAGFEISSTAPAAINASGDSFIFLAIA